MIAGIIGSKRLGIAKKATIHDCPVAKKTGSVLSFEPADVIIGLQAVLNWKSRNPQTPTIVNLSYGSTSSTPIYPDTTSATALAIKACVESKIFVTVSAGNDNMDACGHTLAAIPYVSLRVGGKIHCLIITIIIVSL